MLEEIIINKMVEINDKQYFLLSAYIVNTRILLDVLTELNPPRLNREGIKIPQTYEEHLLEQIKTRQNMRYPGYELIINGQKCRMMSRHSGQSDGIELRKEFLNISIPKELKGKPLELMKYEFEPKEGEQPIEQLILRKKADVSYFIVQQKHTIPSKLEKEYEFRYTDPVTLEDRFLYIREFFAEQIEEDRRNLFGAKENESLLYAAVEFDESIAELNLLTAARLLGGINYTMAPMMVIQPLNDVNRSGYKGLKVPVGYRSPEQEKIEIVLFSIAMKLDNQEDILIYNQ